MEPLNTRQAIPVHLLPDSERLLRTHSSWVASWDGSDTEDQPPDLDALIQEAFRWYARGLFPIQVRWQLAAAHAGLSPRLLTRAQRGAERLLIAAESAPPELRRAQVAAARQTAIQGALAAGDWGPALKGLERAGEIAGELRESAGLAEEDLVLTVSIESEAPALSAAETSETSAESQAETGETEGESQ
jgi:hypothetical protein